MKIRKDDFMSKWVEVRDELIQSVHVEEVTEEMKKGVNSWLLDSALPIVRKAASEFTSQTRKQSADESGWCRIRDAFILPFAIEAGLWVAEKALQKAAQV